MDVKALYPSVPKQEGLEASRKAFENRKNKEIPTIALMQMINIVLENNIFKFGDEHYVQVKGTAIGNKLGRSYACTYMGEWEKHLLQKSQAQPLIFFRYVDDIFGIWTEGKDNLEEFHKLAKTIHPKIQITMDSSNITIPFLDVLVSLCDGKISTTIFEKETDKHMYVHSKSDHSLQCKRAIPYVLGIRAKRICSDEKSYQETKKKITEHLSIRGYQEAQRKSWKKVDNIPRQSLLNFKQRKQSN